MPAKKHTVEIEGRRLQLTNLDKVLYAETGTTKADVIDYYRQIGAVMIPHCRNRPVTRKRWPNGVDAQGTGVSFFQKDIGDGAPEWVRTMPLQHSDHVNVYPLANDLPTLVWFAQLAALELHIPQWQFGEDGVPTHPDRMVFDLDPGEGVGLRECAEVAVLIRDILQGMGLQAMPVTSGSKGIHLYAQLDGTTPSEHVSKVAHELAISLESDHPDDIISTMKRADRPGKVFIDWSQNNRHKTTIAPYSLRGRARPTVAAPRTWRELTSPRLEHLDMRQVIERVAKRGDPLASIARDRQKHAPPNDEDEEAEPVSATREQAEARGQAETREQATGDRLELYRAKRNPGRTREPIPAAVETHHEHRAPVFVIQRHDARRLHYDFRLEHEGVLVSWALPRGVPTDPGRNHLAVHTEDHPLEYRFFEGTIPQGEYGGGEVTIWDSGVIDVEKWQDDRVTVTLRGAPDGGLGGVPRRYALFATGKSERAWLIHLTKEQPAQESSAAPRGVAGSAPEPQESRDRIPAPMLATLASEREIRSLPPREWAFETKWDGYRALAEIRDGAVTFMSRNGVDLSNDYPELRRIAHEVELESATFDGEIVACTEGGIPDFSSLQHGEGQVSYLVFDVLEINGIDTTGLPYRQRRELIEDLRVPAHSSWRVPEALAAVSADDALRVSRERGFEGVVAKRRWGAYEPGRRSREWLKFPFTETAEAVIIGWRHSSADPSGFASLLLATKSGDELRYAGRVGTGFSQRDRHTLRKEFSPLRRSSPAVEVPPVDARDATWIEPQLVGEVRLRGVTSTGKFRHASWRGLRRDKSPATLTPLTP